MLKALGGEPLLHHSRQPAADLLHLGVLQQPLAVAQQLLVALPAGPGSQYVPQPEARAEPEQSPDALLSL